MIIWCIWIPWKGNTLYTCTVAGKIWLPLIGSIFVKHLKLFQIISNCSKLSKLSLTSSHPLNQDLIYPFRFPFPSYHSKWFPFPWGRSAALCRGQRRWRGATWQWCGVGRGVGGGVGRQLWMTMLMDSDGFRNMIQLTMVTMSLCMIYVTMVEWCDDIILIWYNYL